MMRGMQAEQLQTTVLKSFNPLVLVPKDNIYGYAKLEDVLNDQQHRGSLLELTAIYEVTESCVLQGKEQNVDPGLNFYHNPGKMVKLINGFWYKFDELELMVSAKICLTLYAKTSGDVECIVDSDWWKNVAAEAIRGQNLRVENVDAEIKHLSQKEIGEQAGTAERLRKKFITLNKMDEEG